MPKKKSALRRIVDSKTLECMVIKRLLSAVIGFAVGYVYHVISFSHAFKPEEKEYSNMVKWGVLSAATIGSFYSTQCCCIAALCIPTISAKSGRSVIQATLFAWMLSGPISNIFYHTTESIRSISCVAELQENQSKLMIGLMTAPIRKGLGLIVDESESLPKSEKELEERMNDLRVQLLTSAFGKAEARKMIQDEVKERMRQRIEKKQGKKSENPAAHSKRRKKRASYDEQVAQLKEEYENETVTVAPVEVDVAGNMRKESHRVCDEIFEKAYNSCCKLADKTWDMCMDIIPIPLVDRVICQIVWWRAEKKCDKKIKDKKTENCDDNKLDIEDEEVNKNYTIISQAVRNVKGDFKMGLYWMPPYFHERSAMMTVQEISKGVRDEYEWRLAMMSVCVAVARKFLAVTVILVLKASAAYNTKYLTDVTFDNFYISPYFAYKDRQRKRMKKRHLLPLTRLEGKYVIEPTDMRYIAAEKKSMLFKLITLIVQSLFATILFLFDGILYFVMDLIARNAKSDYHVTGRHMLQANIKGNGTISDLMRVLFSGFLDNDHRIDTEGSNEQCLPKPRELNYDYMKWTVTGFVLLIILLCVEGYFLRFRRVICSTFYPRREKRRIVHLYNEMLRQRKQQIQAVRKAVLKLCLTKRLNQKYGLLEAVRIRFPKLGEFLALFGIGRLRCLICETPESRTNSLWRCSNVKCRMLYCNICWIEIDEMCWACNSYRGVEKALPNESKTKHTPAAGKGTSSENKGEKEERNLLDTDSDNL